MPDSDRDPQRSPSRPGLGDPNPDRLAGTRATSDGLLGFAVLGRLGYQHDVVIPPRGKAGTEIEPPQRLNLVLGNLMTALAGTHHAFAYRKYAHRYLAEVGYRFNRRYEPLGHGAPARGGAHARNPLPPAGNPDGS